MQVLSKVEQLTSHSSNDSIITPKSSKDLMQAITKLLEIGQAAAHQLKIFFNNKRLGCPVEDDETGFDDQHHAFDHHSTVALTAFEASLSMLKTHDFDHQGEKIITNKRKIDRTNDDCFKTDHISDAKVAKERRGCYKRRRIGQSWNVEATSLIDDGRAWRKYGQKAIQDTDYPRNYFRCTHKYNQDCQATKQVQQISENPAKYNITYLGQHTCKTLHKTASVVTDESPVESSSLILNFDTYNYPTPKHALNPSLFPPSSSLKSTTTMVNHDHDHDHHSGAHKQYSSSSTDLTSTGLSSTPISSDHSDVISPPEIYSSASTPYEMDEEVWLSLINMEQDYQPHLDGLF